ncbi:MAG: ABC transporter substrate-binding protein [Alphaproteobacteria bacterium]|nr:ABC transporter substrate-binding protein [Alphaproteobacteria bacterium]
MAGRRGPVRPAGVLLAVALSVVLALPARAEALRLGYQSWVASGPFFIARDKGWFADEGVEVELVAIEDMAVRAGALATGELDAMVAMVDATVLHLTPNTELRFVFAVSDSRGADGLVATAEIGTVADLKDKSIAVAPGSTGQFYLNVLLHEAGMTQSDVTIVPLSPGGAGHAFETGEVDAAITWEPWLGRTRERGRGHVVADTSGRPGLLIEAVVARAGPLEQRTAEFAALYRAWQRAVAFARESPEEADAIMAAGIGRWLRHRTIVSDMRAGIAWYDGAANQALFGEPGRPGPLADAVGRAIGIWDSFGKLQVKLQPRDLTSYAVVGW